ncbi:hypothetical protein DOT_3537 [Desulfosporosinus sp. OT]|nr:hypothetical protein DOT_3537 [Desulfosporosinus sp. OT]
MEWTDFSWRNSGALVRKHKLMLIYFSLIGSLTGVNWVNNK